MRRYVNVIGDASVAKLILYLAYKRQSTRAIDLLNTSPAYNFFNQSLDSLASTLHNADVKFDMSDAKVQYMEQPAPYLPSKMEGFQAYIDPSSIATGDGLATSPSDNSSYSNPSPLNSSEETESIGDTSSTSETPCSSSSTSSGHQGTGFHSANSQYASSGDMNTNLLNVNMNLNFYNGATTTFMFDPTNLNDLIQCTSPTMG